MIAEVESKGLYANTSYRNSKTSIMLAIAIWVAICNLEELNNLNMFKF